MNTLLKVISKSTGRDKFDVSPDNIAYLTALLPISEEVQSRCHLKHKITRLVNSNAQDKGTASKDLSSARSSKTGEESSSFILKSQQSLPLTCSPMQMMYGGNQAAQKMLSLDLNCFNRKQTSMDMNENEELADQQTKQQQQTGHFLHPVRNNSHPLQRYIILLKFKNLKINFFLLKAKKFIA